MITPLTGLRSCSVCQLPVRHYERRVHSGERKLLTLDAWTMNAHVCMINGELVEDVGPPTRCHECDSLYVALTTQGRRIEWFPPFTVPPYLDHECPPAMAEDDLSPSSPRERRSLA
jgi:hypothetical protein